MIFFCIQGDKSNNNNLNKLTSFSSFPNLSKYNWIIKIAYVSSLVNYIGIKEYVIVYATLVIMARIISIKFARRLFKKTAINTYNEEV